MRKMSQEATKCEAGTNRDVLGQVTLDEGGLLTLQGRSTGTQTMKQLLDEVKGLHEQRLRRLELDGTSSQVELLQKKEDFLQSYVNDLTDQNQLLVQTIEELQTESDQPSKLDLNQRSSTLQLSHHLEQLRSDVNSDTQVIQQTGPGHHLDMQERDKNVRRLNQDVIGLRATQETLQLTLAEKEKRAQQLVHANTQLKEMLTSLQSKLQTSECTLQGISESLDQTICTLNAERRQKQQIQDQLDHRTKEVELLQQELMHAHRTAEKKMQRREMKICSLMKAVTESKMQHSNRQKELLQREKDLEKLRHERDDLTAKLEVQSRECVHLNQTKEKLEADLALSHDKLHTVHLEVHSRDLLILQLRDEMMTAEKEHHGTQEQVAALESEVQQLNDKVREHQKEVCHLGKKVSDAEHLEDQQEQEKRQIQDRLCINQRQLEACEKKLKKQEDEMGLLHQQWKAATEELKDAQLQIQKQKEIVAIVKLKYAAAMEKVHKVQGQAELFEVELQYSQQQLRESQLEAQSLKREQAELERLYQEKVGQWESAQEALDRLTDELQANQRLLKDGEQKVQHFQSLVASLQDQSDQLKQQKQVLECDLRLHQQSHSHPDEEFLSLQRHRQQFQKRCIEQAERIAECERTILQMKSELERRTQEIASLKQSLALSHHSNRQSRSQLEQDVTRLKNEVTRLAQELADTQEARVALLRKSEEELAEARREAAKGNIEADVHRAEVQRVQEELQKEKEKARSSSGEKQRLSAYIRQLSQELDELHGKHRVTVEDLAARAEEVRRMEGCLNEGKQAEEKIRSLAVKLETEVVELRRNLQQAVCQKLEAETEKQDAQDRVATLRSELERIQTDNVNLRHESQLVITNIKRWITEQSETLTAEMKAQSKTLLVVTKEKAHFQEANDTLKVEVKRLKEVADETAKDLERLKAQIRDARGIRRDEKSVENQTCMALNLGKIEQMQTRLRRNLEAIAILNQQLNTLSGDNKQLRRQLEEERSMRREAERRPSAPPNPQQYSSIRLPLSLLPPPPQSPAFGPGDGGAQPGFCQKPSGAELR